MNTIEERVREFLYLYPELEEAFEVLDITPEDAVIALVNAGLVVLPPFLQHPDECDEEDT